MIKEKVSAETEKRPFDDKKEDIQRGIDEKQNRIEKLGKRFLGRKSRRRN